MLDDVIERDARRVGAQLRRYALGVDEMFD
jgi:hypothetical protein